MHCRKLDGLISDSQAQQKHHNQPGVYNKIFLGDPMTILQEGVAEVRGWT